MSAAKPTKAQVADALGCVSALAEAIRELGSVPNGVLYAHVMGTLTIGQYERSIDLLKRTGLVVEKNHELSWAGPKLEGGGS